MRATLFVVLFGLSAATQAHAATWIVDPSGSGDAATIQGGIDLASAGDIVQVLPGTYTDSHLAFPPWGERRVNVEMKPGVRVESSDGPASTLIDGGAESVDYAVYFPEGCQADCELVGFTLDGSLVGCYVNRGSPTVQGNLFLDHMYEGVQMWHAAPTIENNTFYALPLYAVRVQHFDSAPIVVNNIFAEIGTWAVFCAGELVSLDCNLFWNNAADYDGDCGYQESDVLADPLFCDHPSGDLSLASESPALPENSQCGPIGAFGNGCGAVPVENTSWGRLKAAYR